jgi:hypothetical protein
LKEASSVKHPAAIYAPTGGNRVSESLLLEIQDDIRECAFKSGFPRAPVDSSRRGFDSESGRILHEMMQIAPSEASHQGPRAFMACILLPDIVRWRFPGAEKITSKERFLGGSRGLRNTFGRVWWRAYTLGQPESNQPYEFLNLLERTKWYKLWKGRVCQEVRFLQGKFADHFLMLYVKILASLDLNYYAIQ